MVPDIATALSQKTEQPATPAEEGTLRPQVMVMDENERGILDQIEADETEYDIDIDQGKFVKAAIVI